MRATLARTPTELRNIRKRLMDWWGANRRHLPWRETDDPYRVLLAEILLQQTRFSKVVPAYDRLLQLAPNPVALAATRDQDLEDVVRPLGLVGRARLLKRLGGEIVDRHDGRVPTDERQLLRLSGVGEYTARAVRCFSLNRPEPLVDRMTARFYWRLLGIAPSERPARDTGLWAAVSALQGRQPRDFHLAVIDFTSMICRARKPKCTTCPLATECTYSPANPNNLEMPTSGGTL
jgi:A/G-specific adenine glycosylase